MKKSGSSLLFPPYILLFIFSLLLIHPSHGFAQDKQQLSRDSLISAAREIIGMQTYCALVTIDSSGLPQIRTMNPLPPEDEVTIWFATNIKSRKAKEIKNNPNVVVYFADHSNASGYVAISGKALLVDDQKEITKRWRAYWEQSFPDKRDLVLIKIVPVKMDVLNYKKGALNDPVTWRTPSVYFQNEEN